MVLDRSSKNPFSARTEAAGRHAIEIMGRVRYPPPRFGPGADLEWPGRVERTVVVTSDARTGSTLLCRALAETGLVGLPREYLHWAWFDSGQRVFGSPKPTPAERRRRLVYRMLLRRQWWEFRSIESETLSGYVDELVRRRTSSNGVFALKIHWDNFARQRDQNGFSFEMLPQPISWIHIRRRDLLAQAVSYVKAEQSGVFGITERPPRFSASVHYDDVAILAAYSRFFEGARNWTDFFHQCGVIPVAVAYEELDAYYEGTVSRVLTELGFPDTPVPPAVHRRQADEINAAWIARFRSLHPEIDDGEFPSQP